MKSCDGNPSPLVLLCVVIVDSGISTNDGLAALLSEFEGISVLGGAQEPAKVLALVQAAGPDVLILDLQTDRVADLAALRKVKALPHAPVVIVLSHDDLPPLRRAARAAGADHFLNKATEFGRLHEVLRGLWRDARQTTRTESGHETLLHHDLLSKETP